MVTDAVSERAETEISIPYAGRLALTLLLLALYVLGRFVPLPLLYLDLLDSSFSRERISLVALGITPLSLGFILVELFSLVTLPGHRLRRSGAAGRSRLNRAALITVLLMAALQGMGIAIWLERMTRPDGFPLVPFPGFGFRLLTSLTLTAATAALYAMGQFLSAYGIGNGFALLVLANIGGSIWSAVATGRAQSDSSLAPLLSLLLAVGLAVLAFRFIRSAEDRWIPAFPQGVMPILWGTGVFSLIGVFGHSLSLSPGLAVLVPLIAIPFFSWLTFHLFSSRPRLQSNLSDPEEFLDELAAILRRRALPATALLTLGTLAVLAWREYRPNTIAFSFGFLDVLLAVAIGLDLWDQYRFQKRNGPTALLTQLDNVHFSYRLEELLQEAGIAALARGHQFRSLYFFFGALFKIDVLVPADQLGHARSVLAELETAREIRAF